MPLMVSIPIFRKDMSVEGYLLQTERLNRPVLEVVAEIGLPVFGQAPLVLCPDGPDPLGQLDRCATPKKLIPILPPDVNSILYNGLRERGYHIAIRGGAALPLRLADYWLPDRAAMRHRDRKALILRVKRETSILPIAVGIDSRQDFEAALRDEFVLFTGSFHRQPIHEAISDIPPIKVNLIRLLNIVRSQNYEFAAVAEVVRQDPSLSVSLMRYINSPYIGLRNRVRSIQQAVILLGQNRMKEWVTAAVLKSLGTDRPGELIRMSLIRAQFAENLAHAFGMGEHGDSLFLTGLFSMLDVILGISMQLALALAAPMSEEIVQALQGNDGLYAPVLRLIAAYEMGDWDEVTRHCVERRVSTGGVADAWLNAAAWYNELISHPVKPVRENTVG